LRRTHSSWNRRLIELAEHVVDVHDLAFLFVALGELTRFERRDFHRDLVGLEIDQSVASGYDIAFLLEPPRNRGLNDRFA
jgi:hypothetical protein